VRRQLFARLSARTARDHGAHRPEGPVAPTFSLPQSRLFTVDNVQTRAKARPPDDVLSERTLAEAPVGDGQSEQVAGR
jgi:hypothetical protein